MAPRRARGRSGPANGNGALRIALVLLALVLPAAAAERILLFGSAIEVTPDGDLLVTETIRVKAEGREIKRGIYRDFPQLYKGRFGLKEKRPFEVLSVKRDGKDENFVVEALGSGSRVRIGRAAHRLPGGEYSYEIRYRTGRQLLFFDTHDELYWNVTGNYWSFPIERVEATVVLPDGIAVRSVEAYTGSKGAKGRAYAARHAGNRATIESTARMSPGEGLTVVVTWDPGQLREAAYAGKSILWRDHPPVVGGALLLLAAFLYQVVAWFLVGRDPAKGVVIARFEPPEGFSPAAVRYLDRMGFDNTCFSAAVMGLAVKGAALIRQSGKDYVLKDRGKTDGLLPDETILYAKLLAGRKELPLKRSNHKRIGGARKALQKALRAKLEKRHFFRNLKWWLPGFLVAMAGVITVLLASDAAAPAFFMLLWLSVWTLGTGALVSAVVSAVRSGGWASAVGTGLFALPFVFFWFVGVGFFLATAGVLGAGAFVAGGAMSVAFYHLIKAPTKMGRRAMDEVAGFKHYLGVAEEDRLNLQNPPEKTPELFERFLPYALALGVEQTWSEKFDAVLAAA
ncbi:MAG: DUF2207 domain-containing protein, partial [Akkermansiaceae bacterium]|nr:DUF2207 domain-containing protein [Akkermansiaceae bacterium]